MMDGWLFLAMIATVLSFGGAAIGYLIGYLIKGTNGGRILAAFLFSVPMLGFLAIAWLEPFIE